MIEDNQLAIDMQIELTRDSIRDAKDLSELWFAAGFGEGILVGWESAGEISEEQRCDGIAVIQRAASFDAKVFHEVEE